MSLNKIKIVVTGLAILGSPHLSAAPTITSVNGEITPGSTAQISGSGFGQKTNPQPFKWDDFENGALGNSPSNYGWLKYGDLNPVYTNKRSYSGSQAILRETPYSRDDFNSVGLKGLNSLQIYYSGWFFWEKVSGNFDRGSPVVKLLRVNSSLANTTGAFYSGGTGASFWMTQIPEANGSVWTYAGVVNGNGTDQQDIATERLDPANIIEGKWHRIELYMRLSDPAGSSNGEARVWINGIPSYNKQGVTRTSSDAGYLLDSFLLPGMIDKGGQVMNYFTDDVYVDRTPQRIELCTSPTWENCKTNKTIQKITAWSDTSVSFEVNLETLPLSNKLYAYVIDQNNVANTNGYDLRVNRPNPPTDISAQKTN